MRRILPRQSSFEISSHLFFALGFQVLNNGSLRIHHLQVHDTGYYLCWAENLVQRTHAQIRLEVQSPINRFLIFR